MNAHLEDDIFDVRNISEFTCEEPRFGCESVTGVSDRALVELFASDASEHLQPDGDVGVECSTVDDVRLACGTMTNFMVWP